MIESPPDLAQSGLCDSLPTKTNRRPCPARPRLESPLHLRLPCHDELSVLKLPDEQPSLAKSAGDGLAKAKQLSANDPRAFGYPSVLSLRCAGSISDT